MRESNANRSKPPGMAPAPIRSVFGNSAIPASMALRLDGIPVSHMENMCATGTEVLRAAVYAVASGAVDFALAIGAEKLKDTGYGGLPFVYKGTFNDLWLPSGSTPAGFAQFGCRLPSQAWHHQGRSETRDGARFMEKPPEWAAQPKGSSTQSNQHGADS